MADTMNGMPDKNAIERLTSSPVCLGEESLRYSGRALRVGILASGKLLNF